MGKLSDWVDTRKTANINSYEYDITVNEEMKKLFFEQLENLEFDYEIPKGNNSEIFISTKLSYPSPEFKPFKFLFDTKKFIIIPQFTETHRCMFIPFDSPERRTLENLILYIEDDYTTQRVKDSHKARVVELSKGHINEGYIERTQGVITRDGVDFTLQSFNKFINKSRGEITIIYENTPILAAKFTSLDEISFDRLPSDIKVDGIFYKVEDTDLLNIMVISQDIAARGGQVSIELKIMEE